MVPTATRPRVSSRGQCPMFGSPALRGLLGGCENPPQFSYLANPRTPEGGVAGCGLRVGPKARRPCQLVETKNPSGKPANCQPAGLPRGEMIPYIQANPRNYQLNRACRRNSPKTQITGHLSHIKNFIEKKQSRGRGTSFFFLKT